MNALIQQDSTLIGSIEDILTLQKNSNARLLVIGDSHGKLDVVKEIILGFGSDADALVFCGDGFCDIAACIGMALHDEEFRMALPSVIIPVRGNGDSETYPVTLPIDEDDNKGIYSKLSLSIRNSCIIAGKTMLVVHGNLHSVDNGTEILASCAHAIDADIVFFAHTHVAYWEEIKGTLILNPGSCSSSRSNLPPSFALVSFPGKNECFTVKYIGIEQSLFKKYKFMPLALR